MKGTGPAAGKAVVVGAEDRETKRAGARAIEATDAPTLQGFVRDRAEPGAKVFTDESKSYAGLGGDFDHDTVNHSVGKYVRGMAPIPTGLNRSGRCSSGRTRASTTRSAPNEFAGRHNVREADTLDQTGAVVTGMIGKRLIYRDLIA